MLALTVLLLVNLALAGRLQYTLDQLAFQTKCELVDPTEVDSEQGYKGMEKLTDSNWVAPKGEADGKHVLAYAYGPMFKGYGQIGAWKYNEKNEVIDFWYSKSHCQGMCKDCCDGGKGNEPSWLTRGTALTPSIKKNWRGKETIVKYFEGSVVDLQKFGKYTLQQMDDRWVLKNDEGKMLDHIYACSQSEGIPAFRS
ncbi:unnamed protein product [Durusdinium trenchii]|uniref:Uncharacterized protein n=2 Tax=Durusdinium trenchii TaxID=1381693 RepID=A0ABP0HMX1_9DINO|eukprot:g294.t1